MSDAEWSSFDAGFETYFDPLRDNSDAVLASFGLFMDGLIFASSLDVALEEVA